MVVSYHVYDDDELMEQVRLGDVQAFTCLYDRYGSCLLHYAVSLMHSKEDAADILQEIFVSLWNRREELQFNHSLKAWLYQAVRFQVAKYIHQSTRKRDFLEQMITVAQQTDLQSPQRMLEGRELDYALKRTINTMPARMREVFVLSREAQLSHREIGHKLNIAESTVKKLVQNALRFIREQRVVDYLLLLIIFNFF